MSTSFDLDPVDRITAGAIGEPGERSFFIQGHGGGSQVTLAAEKEQVRLLAEAAQRLLEQLPGDDAEPDIGADDLELIEPLQPAWRVGEMSLEYDEARDLVAVLLTEAVPEDDEAEGPDPATARFTATRGQVAAMAEHALEVVAAGRPRCQLCGYPMPPDGQHPCPARNGHGRPPL